ncbi:MAG: FAD-binding oxidoreductase [Thermoplasmatota archaeon]
MELSELTCPVKTDEASLVRYSMDMSKYRVMPKMVAVPKNESELLELVRYSRENAVPITARAAGSNLSGNAIGEGMIVLFQQMNSIIEIKGRRVRFEPGLVYDKLNEEMERYGYFLPYHVSSSKFCSIGGNVATRASGLRSIKYGTVDTSVRNLRFIDTAHGVVDTRLGIPEDLEKGILALRERLLADDEAMEVLRSKEGLKTSMGYNLWALYKYDDPSEMVAHLLVGSAGTLGLFTEVEMELRPIPPKKIMLVALFPDLPSVGRAVPELQVLGPSLLELMDGFGTDIIRKDTSLDVPDDAGATLLIEFDEDVEAGDSKAREILSKHALVYHTLEDPSEQVRIWGLRWKMLLEIKRRNETADKRYLSFVDDLGVPLPALPDFLSEIDRIFKEEKVPVVIYGHIGEGNLHIRPLIDRENWRSDMRRIGEKCFKAAFKYNGTVAAEHGTGRNRAEFFREEWGDRIYGYFKEVKKLFDPLNLLNPGVMFSEKDFTEDLEF